MKTFASGFAAALACGLLFAGCATTPPAANMVAQTNACDQSKMDAVERESLRRGSQLRWVNCPQAPAGAQARPAP